MDLSNASEFQTFDTTPSDSDPHSAVRLPGVVRHLRLTAEQEIELVRKAQSGDDEARSVLAAAVWRWALACARREARMRGWGQDLEEIASTAGLAITRAIDQFDPSRGFRLTNYLNWRVKGCASDVQRAAIKVPPSATKLTAYSFSTPAALAEAETRVRLAKKASKCLSLAAPLQTDEPGSASLESTLADATTPDSYADNYDRKIERLRLRWAIERLPYLYRCAAAGFFLEQGTMEEIANRFGVTKQAIGLRLKAARARLSKEIFLAPKTLEKLRYRDGTPISLTDSPSRFYSEHDKPQSRQRAEKPPKAAKQPTGARIGRPPKPKSDKPTKLVHGVRKRPVPGSRTDNVFAALRHHGASTPQVIGVAIGLSESSVTSVCRNNLFRFFYPAGDGCYRAATDRELDDYWDENYPGRIPADVERVSIHQSRPLVGGKSSA